MVKRYRVIQFGLGPVGCGIARLAYRKPGIEIVGAVDPAHKGKDLGEVAAVGKKIGIPVLKNGQEVLNAVKGDVVLHATGSELASVKPQLEMMLAAGLNVVSTCEELSYPWREHKDIAASLDRTAKGHGVTLLGTGVNPGFLMDTWPLMMTGVCQDVHKIKVVRIQDATSRRIPFQNKIGAGRTMNEFKAMVKDGIIRHVGLSESIGMIAAGLGLDIQEIRETIDPVISTKSISNGEINIAPGQVGGVRQVGVGLRNGNELIRLEFEAAMGAEESYDAVYITGNPNLEIVIKGGTHGDLATAAMVVNSIPRVVEAPSGLICMKDLPPACSLAGNEHT